MYGIVPTQDFPRINILGVNVSFLTAQELVQYLVVAASGDSKAVVCYANVHTLNVAKNTPTLRAHLNSADLVFCDGFGVLVGARLLGHALVRERRATAPDFLDDLGRACALSHTSLYLLGGLPGVVDKAIARLMRANPQLRTAGSHGYFQKTGEENHRVIEAINRFRPDILYVGFGSPLQEEWIAANRSLIDAHAFLALGACLDFYTGTVKRGPRWMTEYGGEWVSRLLIEPRRLWRRYLIGNPLFFCRIARQLLSTALVPKKVA